MSIRLALAAVALSAVPLTAQLAAGNLLYARLDSYLDALRQQAGIPGLSAAVVGETDIVWERGFGRLNLDRAVPVHPDTPFHLDGLGQIVTATLTLQCAERGTASLDDLVGNYDPGAPDPGATLRQLLSHTSAGLGLATFAYRPERLEPLRGVIRRCTGDSFRENVANLFDRLAMRDSIPGADAPHLVPPAEGIPEAAARQRYSAVLERLATSYLVPGPGRAIPTQHQSGTISAHGGLISTVRDLAQLDVALKQGLLVTPEALAAAWTPVGGGPHGLGWFVSSYNGQPVVWQFGVSEASSSFVITLPARRLTMILLANSDGLVGPFALTGGVVTASPFARAFLGLFGP